jgi:hypothetical protein
MKSTLTGALLALALLGVGSAALADDAMMAKPDKTMATLVCRPAKAGETPTAMTAAKADLVCKPLDMKPIMAMEKSVMAMPNGDTMWNNLLSSFQFEYGR